MTGQTEAPAPVRRSERTSGINRDVNGAPYDPRYYRCSGDGLFRRRHCLLCHLAAQQDGRLTLTGKQAEIMSQQVQARLFTAYLLWVCQAHNHLKIGICQRGKVQKLSDAICRPERLVMSGMMANMEARNLAALNAFRSTLYAACGRRRDALFALCDTLLTTGPVASQPHLSLAPFEPSTAACARLGESV